MSSLTESAEVPGLSAKLFPDLAFELFEVSGDLFAEFDRDCPPVAIHQRAFDGIGHVAGDGTSGLHQQPTAFNGAV